MLLAAHLAQRRGMILHAGASMFVPPVTLASQPEMYVELLFGCVAHDSRDGVSTLASPHYVKPGHRVTCISVRTARIYFDNSYIVRQSLEISIDAFYKLDIAMVF